MENFNATYLNLVNDGIIVLEGNKSNTLGMWQVNLTRNSDHPPSHPQLSALNALAARTNPEL